MSRCIYNGVEYPSLPEMELAVGKKSPNLKFKVQGIWFTQYVDYSQEHLEKIELENKKNTLMEKKQKYDYLCKELLFQDNAVYKSEALILRDEIALLESQIGDA